MSDKDIIYGQDKDGKLLLNANPRSVKVPKLYTQAQHDQAIKEAVENVCKERDEEIKNEILKLFPHFDSTANTILLMISNMPPKTGN